jgi:hypothetical protein
LTSSQYFGARRFFGNGDRFAPGEVIAGEGFGDASIMADGAAEDEAAAGFAAAGAELDEVIGGADDGLLVLDDEERVALVAQVFHHADEAADVALVEADARLVHDEEGIDQRGAEAGGEVDALDLAAAQGLGRAVERSGSRGRLPRGNAAGSRLRRIISVLGSSLGMSGLERGDDCGEFLDRDERPVRAGCFPARRKLRVEGWKRPPRQSVQRV